MAGVTGFEARLAGGKHRPGAPSRVDVAPQRWGCARVAGVDLGLAFRCPIRLLDGAGNGVLCLAGRQGIPATGKASPGRKSALKVWA